MPALSFVGGALTQPLTVVATPDEPILDLVRRCDDLPLSWRCGRGTCGTCAVRVRHPQQPQPLLMSRKERNVLVRHRYLPQSALQQETFIDSPDLWRLACYLTANQPLVISLDPPSSEDVL